MERAIEIANRKTSLLLYASIDLCYNEYKMSPTSISGGGNLLTGGELISPASCDAKLVPVGKGQEEVLPSAKLEQWPYNHTVYALIVSDISAKS